MTRRKQGELVENEERVLVGALSLFNAAPAGAPGIPRFWVKDVQAELGRIEPGLALNDSTVNRALKRFVGSGWLIAAWETDDPDDHQSSKPRLYFRFTDAGLLAARRVIVQRRSQHPPWVLHPSIVGERTLESPPALPSSLPLRKPATLGSAADPQYHLEHRRSQESRA